MKRLLCILYSLNVGGAETFMMKIFRTVPVSLKIDFVVSAKDGYYEKEVLGLGGKIYRIPLRTQHPFKTFMAIMRIVRENQYTHVLKLTDTPIGAYDLLAAKFGGAEKLCVRSCNSSANLGLVSKVANRVLQPILNSLADVKMAPSLSAARFTFGEKVVEHGDVHVVNNALDTELYKFDENLRIIIRNEFNVDNETLLLGHIGRFSYQKNHVFLIEVFRELLKVIPNSKLLLVGVGELFEDIKLKAGELGILSNIIFAGCRSDITALLSAMDLMLLPSFFEGMPNVVIEAQSTGLKCILSDTITKEAAVTDLVRYLSIKEITCWIREITEFVSLNVDRKEYSRVMRQNGYDINDNILEIVNMIFGEE